MTKRITRRGALKTTLMAATLAGTASFFGPWKHNRNEVADRVALYRYQRVQLANFFGVPPGPALAGSGGQMVV